MKFAYMGLIRPATGKVNTIRYPANLTQRCSGSLGKPACGIRLLYNIFNPQFLTKFLFGGCMTILVFTRKYPFPSAFSFFQKSIIPLPEFIQGIFHHFSDFTIYSRSASEFTVLRAFRSAIVRSDPQPHIQITIRCSLLKKRHITRCGAYHNFRKQNFFGNINSLFCLPCKCKLNVELHG